MGALSETMLTGGCARHVESIHGETVTVLSGPDAGKTFTAVNEIESDLVLSTDLGADPRAKIMLRFTPEQTPNIKSQEKIRTANGKTWNAIRQDFSAFLTNDFELKEIVPGKDT